MTHTHSMCTAHTHTYIYMYIYTYIYACIHTYMYMGILWLSVACVPTGFPVHNTRDRPIAVSLWSSLYLGLAIKPSGTGRQAGNPKCKLYPSNPKSKQPYVDIYIYICPDAGSSAHFDNHQRPAGNEDHLLHSVAAC